MTIADMIEKSKADVLDESKRSMLAVDAAAQRACAAIMERKSELQKQISQSEKEQTDSIADAMKDFKLYTEKVDRGLAFLSDLQDNDICLEVVDSYKGFSSKMKLLRDKFTSNCVPLQYNVFSESQHSKTAKVGFGLSNSYFFYGKLGNMQVKLFSLSVDKKSFTISKKLRGLTLIKESQAVKSFIRFIIAFFIFQFFLWIWDESGAHELIQSQIDVLIDKTRSYFATY